ncbi:MAG: BMP family ABC transporter substrate-binding protein [Clostridiales bacterium]|nr:MAG: BMP family ABC transporter substrate-binding protein [Clostridiales bacterium]
MSKKVIALLLMAIMCLSVFAGCNNAPATDNGGSDSDKASFKVGAIYITSQNDTAGYTFAHHYGITKAMENLGLSKDNLFIVDNVAEDKTQVSNAIDTLAGKGCNIIFGISFGYIEAFAEAAEKEEYKDIIFSHATGYKANKTNFNNYFGRIYQARYLTGVAAGLKALELKNPNIGYVAAWGTEYAETCSGINAFALGVQAVYPEAIVHVNKISTWGDEAKEKQAAEALIDTYNCCVIAQHCDSAQPQKVAEARGVFSCGYNSDMTAESPKAQLTSAIWNWPVYYQTAIEAAKKDPANFMTNVGIYYGGLKENFVGISPVTANCAAGTKEILEKVSAMITSGDWDVFQGTKLSISQDGTITKTTAATLDNKDATVIAEDGTMFCYVNNALASSNEFGAFEHDAVIKGSMNYFVKGVVEG